MVFDAFRKRNSHRVESSVTPLWRRGAAALAVGAVLGTTGVVGASAIDAPSAFAAAGDENIPDRDCDPKDAKPARWGESSDMAVPTDTDACHFMGWVNVTNQEPTTLPNTGDPVPELKTAKVFNVYEPSDSRLKVTVNADESLTIDASDVPLDVVTDMGGKNPTAVYVVDLVGEDGTYYGRLGVYADLTPLPGDDAGSEEISAWEDSIKVPSGQSVTYDAHEIPAGTVIDNEKYLKENLRVTRNSDGTLTIDATETPEGALGTMYFFHPDNPDQRFGMLAIEVVAPEDGTEEPGEGTEEPGNGTEEPGNGTEEPGNGTEEPGNGTEEPGDDAGEQPGDDAEQPGDNAGEQPGSDSADDASSSRPTKPVKVVPAKGGRHALPRTGAETGGLLAAAASLLAGGAALVTRRRKNEQ